MQILTHPKPIPSRANTAERLANLTLQPLPTPPSSDHSEPEEDLRHIFAIGDCAETGAIQAGHTAYWQAEVAARNVCRMIEKQEGRAKETLESYKPGAPCIKLTLGLVSDLHSPRSHMTKLKTQTKAVTATGDEVVVSEDGVEDLKALLMW
jgi:NADH dehydrogenase FAD-containing subunit